MPIFGEKPHTSITVKIDQLSKPHRNEDLEDESIELFLDDLIQLIKLQPSTGATEAARAIRKNIKYGNSPDEQVQALNLLELLVLNSGPKIGPILSSDDKLLDVLKGVMSGSGRTGLGGNYDPRVQQKVRNLAIGWKLELKDLDGYKYMASLWKFLPRLHLRQASASQSDFEDGGSKKYDHSGPRGATRVASPPLSPREESRKSPPPRPMAISPYTAAKQDNDKRKKSKKKSKRRKNGIVYADSEYQIPQINYKVEAPKIRTVIANCHTHTTALHNALLALPTGTNALDDTKVTAEFEKCRKIRRSVLRYLQYVGAGDEASKSREVLAMDEEFLGSLIVANEQLVSTFQEFDKACGYSEQNPAPTYEDESDESYYLSDSSDDELSRGMQDVTVGSSASRPAPPPPAKREPIYEPAPVVASSVTGGTVDSDDPFGDSNAVSKGGSMYD